jgi:hypothetical protein
MTPDVKSSWFGKFSRAPAAARARLQCGSRRACSTHFSLNIPIEPYLCQKFTAARARLAESPGNSRSPFTVSFELDGISATTNENWH